MAATASLPLVLIRMVLSLWDQGLEETTLRSAQIRVNSNFKHLHIEKDEA
jgi:hypothetical protein